MYRQSLLCLVATIVAVTPATTVAEQDKPDSRAPKFVPEIVVIGSADRRYSADITPGASAAPVPDAMEVLTRMPGANVNRNGPLSGQAQYRGLFGPRMTVTVNGMRVTPGGPNWMDAPLHYLPAGLTDNVTMTRGIAPVSAGPGIGGLIEAESKASEFTANEAISVSGDAIASTMTNTGTAVSGFLALANDAHRFHVLASDERGDNVESSDGEIGATEYDRETYAIGYGFRQGDSEISVEFSHTDTGSSGTPSLPLDIAFFDTDRLNIAVKSQYQDIDLSFRVFGTDIEHGMDNFQQRRTPDISQLPLPPFQGDDKRLVDATAEAIGFVATAATKLGDGDLVVGVDGDDNRHDAVVFDPDFSPFFVTNFEDSERRALGLFGEWFGPLGRNWSMEAGARFTRVETDSGTVDAFPAQLADGNPAMFGPGTPPFAVKALRDRFNASDRSRTDNNVDVVLKFDYTIDPAMRLGFGYGRKTRSPLYLERYLWIPLEVNSGLGDFNNYVGNVDLDPETSDQLEISFDWTFDKGHLSPRLFYRSIDDYIQGVAVTDPVITAVSGAANGDPTPLQFANVEAELYGFDIVARYRFSENWRLDATLNYVRGKRTDVGDDLFRIAPLNGRLALTADLGNWSLTAESVLVAAQDKISRTIVTNEPRAVSTETPGYGVLNLYGRWHALDNVSVRFGVENLFDKSYANHLAGFNRVSNSSVPVGTRIPGAGINVFGQLQLSW